MFIPEKFDIKHNELTDDEMLVHAVACAFACPPASVVEYAAEHAGLRYSMDDFYVDPKLPWQIRQFIRDNSPLNL